MDSLVQRLEQFSTKLAARPAVNGLAGKKKDETGGGMKSEERQKLVETLSALIEGKQDVFHSPDGEPFARVEVGDHKENYPLKSKGLFQSWCEFLFFVGTGE